VRHSVLSLLVLIATSHAWADSLVIDFPDVTDTNSGSNLVIQDASVSIVAASYVHVSTDGIHRSGFDTGFWQWQVVIDGALAEGWGQCVLTRGAPDAYLRCDS